MKNPSTSSVSLILAKIHHSFSYLYVHHGYLRLELNLPALFTRFAQAGVDHKIAEEAISTNHRRDLAC